MSPLTVEEPASSNTPVFIVGTPRSGTTLLASRLSSHSAFQGGPETFFFSCLAQSGAPPEALLDSWPTRALAFLESLQLERKPLIQVYGLSAQELRRFLEQSPPSIASILSALMVPYASRHGKRRWVEKTPRHLWNVDLIRRYFPESSVIRIVRDPRDIALSLQKVPWASDSLIANSFRCATDRIKSDSVFDNCHRTLTVRFEDLLSESTHTLTKVCDFLGEEFEPQMTIAERSTGSLFSNDEPWKLKVNESVDPSRTAVWKREFPTELLPASELVTHELLEEFGYEYSHTPRSTTWLAPCTRQFIEENERMVVEEASYGSRFLPATDLSEYERLAGPDEPILLTQPFRLGRTSATRAKRLAKATLQLAKFRLTGRRVQRIGLSNDRQHSCGVADRLGRAAMQLLTQPSTVKPPSNINNP